MEDAAGAGAIAEIRVRVSRAFQELENTGFVAKMRFGCCMSCAMHELSAIAEKAARDRAVYWHEQDEEHFQEGGPLHIRYCHLPMPSAEEELEGVDGHIANQVAAALKNAGLQIEWDGSPRTTIQVTGISGSSTNGKEETENDKRDGGSSTGGANARGGEV